MEWVWFIWLLGLTGAVIYTITRRKQNSSNPAQSLLNSNDPLKYFQYFSLVKFNPFSDTGGEQSFILTLLDGQKTGVIITSLHGRGVTRFYAKKIIAGQPEVELSSEEKQALMQALTHST